MQKLVLALFGALLVLLLWEARAADKSRRQIKHVIYVNGTRGKSSVTRLIDAGLRASGKKVFCKTTGTLPMTIDVHNDEQQIHRVGKANIKEQLKILRRAAAQGAELLVVECMAVAPVLQHVSQHRMLRADIAVLTNVRLDHTDEMGYSLPEICDSLCSTIPAGGVVFTAETQYFDRIERHAHSLGATAFAVTAQTEYADIDFPENVSLALAVCEYLGVQRAAALACMRQYKRDPYALSLHRLPSGALFINALSVNDPQSSRLVYAEVLRKLNPAPERLILLLNNRPDRGYRTEHMLLLARLLRPQKIWLLGASQQVAARRLRRADFAPEITLFDSVSDIPFSGLDDNTVVFAAGNLANGGTLLMERIRKEAAPCVS